MFGSGMAVTSGAADDEKKVWSARVGNGFATTLDLTLDGQNSACFHETGSIGKCMMITLLVA